MKEKLYIQSIFVKQSNQDKTEYQIQSNVIVDCIIFLLCQGLCQGLAFCSHDKSQDSSNKGNFLELLQFLAEHNESINEVLQDIQKNCKLMQQEIKKTL